MRRRNVAHLVRGEALSLCSGRLAFQAGAQSTSAFSVSEHDLPTARRLQSYCAAARHTRL